MITVAIAGKPNSGKSTFFKAATLADVEIAPYPFTTISPNTGIAYVRVECPCQEETIRQEIGTGGGGCGNCIGGSRFVPVELLDVAGLVRGAHEGRGLGNEFLDELRQAEAIIHVVDVSGGTDANGNLVEIGSHDPLEDIKFFETELNMWVYLIIERGWRKIVRRAELEGLKIERLLSEQLAGLGVREEQIKMALLELESQSQSESKSQSGSLDTANLKSWTDDDLKKLASVIIKRSKKMLIAANKADVAPEENIKKFYTEHAIPCSAEAELALRTAAKKKIIAYLPGDADFEIVGSPTEKQRKGLEAIRSFILAYGSTGVQSVINHVVFDLLDYVVVYPVKDEHKFSDSVGKTLPDALLLKMGNTARDLAFSVHSEIGESYLYAIDARTKLRLGEKYALKTNDIIKVVYR